MRSVRVWARLFGVEQAVLEGVEFDAVESVVVARVRVRRGARHRCPHCRRRCAGYDAGVRRRWRALDLGTVRAVIEADAPRVSCRVHGVIVAAVPWARHGAGHTRAFDQVVAWLAVHAAKSVVSRLMRISWRTVGAIVARVWADTGDAVDRLDGLRRIGIDEVSYKKGHRYLSVVVDHDTGRLVWAAAGKSAATLHAFFDLLGPERAAAITHVSADGADWITTVVRRRCPNAVRCADPFHVVAWASDAVDRVRRQVWNAATGRGAGRRGVAVGEARLVKNTRWALWKNPNNLTDAQRATLAWIAKTHPRLHRAWALKEGLRYVFTLAKTSPPAAVEALDRWVEWARRSRIDIFVDLQRRVTRHRDAIIASITHGLSNGRIESVNAKIRLITRMAFGFHSPDALIALAMLNLGGHQPQLPNR
ncbi:ISL3 family transposase [Micromonospora robiginosa]|uniref:ISL3 family transposase n=1 Tax=Micromonospora robiginosa TaxID=2749844 RepID=A0A7L6BF64_9ACTN|nr:ISL3 family transposase [Micromonospora ferruginea]QLQ40157.1 ISL3 family transposase [Micromonospora ferruginea]QLQ40568.1 ISL3 family transposase [Micromonospora ferruginea]WMF04570.1 ISL3 family transposase [Micromonospora ferruginea]